MTLLPASLRCKKTFSFHPSTFFILFWMRDVLSVLWLWGHAAWKRHLLSLWLYSTFLIVFAHYYPWNITTFFFFSEQVVNMASIYTMFNARRVLAFFTSSRSVSCTPCKAGRGPPESWGLAAAGGISEQSWGWKAVGEHPPLLKA